MTSSRITFASMLRAGAAAVTRYTGTLFAVFLLQSIVALASMIAMAVVLAQAFSQVPLWDDAVDGDLVALAAALRFASANVLACVGIGSVALLLWQITSWFLAGGIYGVLVQRPEGRSETARCFGACGASTYLAYARLALFSLPSWIGVALVFATCTNAVSGRAAQALTLAELVGPLALSVLPPLALAQLLWTVADYTRVELSLQPYHEYHVLASYAHSFLFVLRTPLTWIHSGLGNLGLVMITAAYAILASGHPMFGTLGAIALFTIRQGISLARTAVRFGVLAGQIELGQGRTLRRSPDEPAR